MKSDTPVTAEAVIVDENADLIPQNAPPPPSAPPATIIPDDPSASHYGQSYILHSLPHPENAPPGGTWGKQHFRGPITAAATVGGVLIACFPGLLMLIFRLDQRDAYKAPDGTLYTVQGKRLGHSKKLKFVPERPIIATAVPVGK